MKKRILGALLCFFLLAALIPSGTAFATEESLFDRFIPIEQTYSAYVDNVYNLESGKNLSLKLGTKFDNEMGKWSIDTQLKIKRSDYKGGFLKLEYVGKYGSLSAELVEHVSILDPDTYAEITTPPYTTSYTLGLDINKDTAIVQIDLYDVNKKFVRTISPGTMILASSATGEFVTFSSCYQKEHVIYFSHKNDFFAADADESNSKIVTFELATATVHNKEDIAKLLSAASAAALKKPVEKYNYISYPEATGQENINANELLSDHEFITPDNTYYYIGIKNNEIDPVVLHKIENVVDYSRYNHSITPGYTQRNIVTADGTLYGLTNKHEKKVLASNALKTSMNHYMTKDGKVIELESGKVIATDCKDFAEANTAWTIGAIKNDGSFWLGYTYKGDATAYKRGLEKKLDSAKLVVPEGVVDSNNRFYRWNETVTKMSMDENAWSMGFFQEKNDYKVDLVYVCDNAYRVFPSEKLSKIGVTSEELVHETVTGFVLTKSGDLYGYGFWYNEKFGNFGMVEEIFTLRETATDGNFVGIKSEGSNVINAIVCRACDNNRYIQGKVYDRELNTHPEFYTVTRNGFLATNGKVYSVDRDSEGVKNSEIWATPNQDADFGQMHRGTQTFKAYAFGKDTTINLLPSVTSWAYDNSNICLLERKDGSVWMAAFYRNGQNAAITESLGGYENTNAIQITQPTTKKAALDYVEVGGGSAKPSKSFTDVKSDAYYANAVAWAIERQITAGTSDTTFSPDNTCTRAQILTFLWRAVGSPKMSGANPFSDVKQSDYYYDAALWANSKGMITGNTFAGNTPCTRSATVTYLWKNAGSPSAVYSGNFSDVSGGSDYAQAVAWAVNNGVTSGISATTFSPDTTCTRGQIVTFLMRALNK